MCEVLLFGFDGTKDNRRNFECEDILGAILLTAAHLSDVISISAWLR